MRERRDVGPKVENRGRGGSIGPKVWVAMWRVLIVFFAGGAGSALRYGVSVALAGRASWPLATFAVNVCGCFVMGLALGMWAAWDAGAGAHDGDSTVGGEAAIGLSGAIPAGAASGSGDGVVARASVFRLAVATGLLGGFTTYSAFAGETVKLAGERSLGIAGAYVVGTNAVCLAACAAGFALARGIAGR